MKFFTRAWANGELSDEATQAIGPAYRDYLDSLNLSPHLRELADLNSHDGYILNVNYDEAANSLKLRLRCGDLQVGYFDATLVFADAVIPPNDVELLRQATRPNDAEILYDEVDVLGRNKFEYRMLLWPDGEAAIRFRDVSLNIQNVLTRESP